MTTHQESPLLRYVVLRHEGIDQPHFDLLFETAPGSPLAAWRADAWPLPEGAAVQLLPDHRRLYLDYEGPVSGNRGTVRRIHAGRHMVEQDDSNALVVRLENGTAIRLPRQAAAGNATLLP